MAIDTLTKRSAALRYGRGRTRQPEATSSAFVRGAGLGLYYIAEQITAPNDGWIMPPRQRQWIAQTADRHWVAQPTDRLWIVPQKDDET